MRQGQRLCLRTPPKARLWKPRLKGGGPAGQASGGEGGSQDLVDGLVDARLDGGPLLGPDPRGVVGGGRGGVVTVLDMGWLLAAADPG